MRRPHTPKHLVKRGEVYYFRIAIPTDLRDRFGCHEVKASLHTSNRILACIRSRFLSNRLEHLFMATTVLTELTQEQLQEIARDYFRQLVLRRITWCSSEIKKIDERQRELRDRLWPEVTEDDLWFRQKSKGFATLPRTIPLMLAIMDDMAKTTPISATYLELFCRGFDDCMIILSKPREMAFHAGFTGQRAERTWKDRLKILNDLGLVQLKEGPSGPMSYALILNPYRVIKSHYEKRHPGVTGDKYNALMARAIEIGAKDLDAPIKPEKGTKRKKT